MLCHASALPCFLARLDVEYPFPRLGKQCPVYPVSSSSVGVNNVYCEVHELCTL